MEEGHAVNAVGPTRDEYTSEDTNENTDVGTILPRDGFLDALDSLAQQANPWFSDALEHQRYTIVTERDEDDMYEDFGKSGSTTGRSAATVHLRPSQSR